MSQENYEQLIRDWAQLTGATDVDGLLQRGRVRVGDTVIDLVHHDEEEALVLLVGYFGKLPSNDGGIAAQALLHANFTLQVLGHSLCWSVNPRTEQVIAHGRLPLASLDAPALHQCLQSFAEMAVVWHATAEARVIENATPAVSVSGNLE
jgi:hypothetical protein